MDKESIVRSLKNVKLVIGNGFDLYCGINTRYSDFFSENANLYNEIKQFNNEVFLHKKIYNIGDECLVGLEDISYRINISKKITVWDIFFSMQLKDSCKLLWCDIEEEIRKSLNSKSQETSSENLLWNNVFVALKNSYITGSIGISISQCDYLCASFLKNKFDNQINEFKFYNVLLDELKRFEKRFGEFVNEQAKSQNYIQNVAKAVDKLVSLENNPSLSIDSFNYTNAFPENIICKNINGVCEEPIFGIDSSSLEKIDEKYIFTKIYRRIELSLKKSSFYDEAPFENIIIFGHSLNEQDYNYFFPLFNKLKITDKDFKGKIVFAYFIYDESKKMKLSNN